MSDTLDYIIDKQWFTSRVSVRDLTRGETVYWVMPPKQYPAFGPGYVHKMTVLSVTESGAELLNESSGVNDVSFFVAKTSHNIFRESMELAAIRDRIQWVNTVYRAIWVLLDTPPEDVPPDIVDGLLRFSAQRQV